MAFPNGTASAQNVTVFRLLVTEAVPSALQAEAAFSSAVPLFSKASEVEIVVANSTLYGSYSVPFEGLQMSSSEGRRSVRVDVLDSQLGLLLVTGIEPYVFNVSGATAVDGDLDVTFRISGTTLHSAKLNINSMYAVTGSVDVALELDSTNRASNGAGINLHGGLAATGPIAFGTSSLATAVTSGWALQSSYGAVIASEAELTVLVDGEPTDVDLSSSGISTVSNDTFAGVFAELAVAVASGAVTQAAAGQVALDLLCSSDAAAFEGVFGRAIQPAVAFICDSPLASTAAVIQGDDAADSASPALLPLPSPSPSPILAAPSPSPASMLLTRSSFYASTIVLQSPEDDDDQTSTSSPEYETPESIALETRLAGSGASALPPLEAGVTVITVAGSSLGRVLFTDEAVDLWAAAESIIVAKGYGYDTSSQTAALLDVIDPRFGEEYRASLAGPIASAESDETPDLTLTPAQAPEQEAAATGGAVASPNGAASPPMSTPVEPSPDVLESPSSAPDTVQSDDSSEDASEIVSKTISVGESPPDDES